MTVTGADGPLAGVRVVELTHAQAGRTTGMLLADLGAEVVRVVPPEWGPAPPGSADGPEELVWDRGKRFVPVTHERGALTGRARPDPVAVGRLVRDADVLLDDLPAAVERPIGVDAAQLLATHPRLVHVRMPPCGHVGRWRDLPADPLLTAALGGFAVYHPSYDPGSPIASVVPVLGAVHAALGAATAVAGLLGARTTGHGRVLEVSGLHASAACLATLVVEGLDVAGIAAPDGRLPTRPNFRTYRCSDGRWMHLSALTVDFFLPALAVLDRMDVMVMPGVDGEFTNLFLREIGRAVGRELERTFAERTRAEWLAALAEAGVPSAPVRTREEWLEGEVIASAAPPVTLPHPVAGPVRLPGVPIALSDTPGAVRHLPTVDRIVAAGDPWTAGAPDDVPGPGVGAGPVPALPLAGLRVVDLSTFLAAPFAGALLAELGATVVKIESPDGDPYRVYSASYAAVNHAKTVASVDLRSEAGRAALLELAGEADVLIDNLRPASAARFGLDQVVNRSGPRLVRCSVSAFGRSGPFAELPGFDPVMQSWSGLAAAQGGDDEPVATSAPTVDVGTGALAALGVLAALVARTRTGRGQHVTTSLAATSTFLQLAELTTYPGRPPGEAGGRDYRGPRPARRYHRAVDGWLALAAATPEQERAVVELLGLEALTHDAVESALAAKPVEHWLAELARVGVPACTVPSREDLFADAYLVENGFTHVVRDPEFGRFRLVRGYVRPIRPGPVPSDPVPWPRAIALLESTGRLREGYTVVPDDRLGG